MWEVDSRVEAQELKNTRVGRGIPARHPTEEFGMLGTNRESVSIILAPAWLVAEVTDACRFL